MLEEVLSFWFEEIPRKSWWSGNPDIDELIRSRFGETHRHAAHGAFAGWRSEPSGRLAEIIVLDQFSRNIHRGTPLAFATDPMALMLAQEAVATNVPHALNRTQCDFVLMPYMHSESATVHALAEPLFRQHAGKRTLKFELRHRDIIDRFGRYPHRNAILGRMSTPEEIEFLKQPGSSF